MRNKHNIEEFGPEMRYTFFTPSSLAAESAESSIWSMILESWMPNRFWIRSVSSGLAGAVGLSDLSWPTARLDGTRDRRELGLWFLALTEEVGVEDGSALTIDAIRLVDGARPSGVKWTIT